MAICQRTLVNNLRMSDFNRRISFSFSSLVRSIGVVWNKLRTTAQWGGRAASSQRARQTFLT